MPTVATFHGQLGHADPVILVKADAARDQGQGDGDVGAVVSMASARAAAAAASNRANKAGADKNP